jgi:hypothetical protein
MIQRNFLTCSQCGISGASVVEVPVAGACGSESITDTPKMTYLCPACIAKSE